MDIKDVNKNLFYRPDLSVEKDYGSSGKFEHPNIQQETEIAGYVEKTVIEKLYEQAKENEAAIIKMREAIAVLPKEIQKHIQQINDFLFIQEELELNEINTLRIQEIQDQEKEIYKEYSSVQADTTSNIWNGNQDTQLEPDYIYVDDEGFVWNEMEATDISISVDKAKSNAEQAKEQYLIDSTDLKEDYLLELNDVMADYIYPLSTYMSEIGISQKSYLDQPYDGSSVTGVGVSSQHLHDTILRNELDLEELGLLMDKTHDTSALLNTFAAWDIASQERIRYYTEEYKNDIKTYLDIKKNDMLLDCREAYDEKYTICKLNAYKFLKSAVELAREMCNLDIASKAAKCALLEADVNIYATKKYDTITVSNSTSAGLSGNKPSSATAITGDNANVAKAVEKKIAGDSEKVKDTVKKEAADKAKNELKNKAKDELASISQKLKDKFTKK